MTHKKIFITTLLALSLLTPAVAFGNTGDGQNVYDTPVNTAASAPSGTSAGAKGLPPYAPLEPIPGVSSLETGATGDFPSLINKIIPILLTFGSMFAVVSLVWGGIVYMTSEVVNKKSWAISKIRSSLLGLLLLLMAYVFLNTINPQLVTFSSLANGPSGPANNSAATGGTQNQNTGSGNITDANSCTSAGRSAVTQSCSDFGSPSGCIDFSGGACLP